MSNVLPRRSAEIFMLGVLVLALVLPNSVTAPAADAATTITPGTMLGFYVQPRDGWSREQQEASINNLESYLGRTIDIDHIFFKWDGNVFPNWRQAWDLQHGRIPMISWGGTYLKNILNGSYDSMIRTRANALEALNGPVMLRWFGEMDAAIYDNDEIESPAQFIQAWRYVHDIFVAQGATNVEWVWSPNAFNFATGKSQTFFPGDAYVDWIGADGYNWAPGKAGASWNPFKNVFASFYSWAAPKPQPLMIGETGVQERGAGEKAQWITDMGNTIKNSYPEIKALVYFDAYATANFGGWYDFRVDTSASSYAAFRTLAQDPYFNGTAVLDTVPPTVPTDLNGSASGLRVDLTWTPSTDNVGVQGYDVYRDGAMIGTTKSASFSDPEVAAGTTYSYAVRARDGSGNESSACGAVSVSVPTAAATFADGFETGSMGAWTSATRMEVHSGGAYEGTFSGRAMSTGVDRSYAVEDFPKAKQEIYARTYFNVSSQLSTMNLLRLQSPSGANIFTLFVNRAGELMFRNDGRATVAWSSTKVSQKAWHQVQIRVKVGAAGETEVWYDGQRIDGLSLTQNLGTTGIGRLMLGDNVRGRAFDVSFDEVAAGTAPIS